MRKTIRILAVFLAILCVISIAAFDNRLKIVHYNLKTDKISGSIKLALITDLHCCLYGKNQSLLIEKLEKNKPDAVLLVGDIFDDQYVNDNSHVLINNIVQNYKTYYVSGNHEWWSGKMYDHFEFLKAAGVTVLRGDSTNLTVGEDTVVISGVDDPDMNKYDTSYKTYEEQFEAVTENISYDNYNVLLAHRPEKAKQYFDAGFDLALSGHAHGGQVRIPLLLNGLYAPNQGLFPEFAGGIYDNDGQKMIVSRGLSRENTILPRIFNRPELVLISLTN